MIEHDDILWTAGFLEGDGSFQVHHHNDESPMVTAIQKELWPVAKLHKLYGGSLYVSKGGARKSLYNQWNLWSWNAVDLMEHLYAHMSPKSKARIDLCMIAWGSHKRYPKMRVSKQLKWRSQ